MVRTLYTLRDEPRRLNNGLTASHTHRRLSNKKCEYERAECVW